MMPFLRAIFTTRNKTLKVHQEDFNVDFLYSDGQLDPINANLDFA